MKFPKATTANATERKGVIAVAKFAASNNQIWRETSNTDVGIDGQIEFVTPTNEVTGKVIAVQVKSGLSYFSNETTDGWRQPIASKHRMYWEAFPVPVILIVHNPETEISYWTDVRQQMRASKEGLGSIIVPKSNSLDATNPITLFQTAGATDEPFMEDLDELLDFMIDTRSSDVNGCLSYFDLFAFGLTNICRSLYFGTDLAMTALQFNYSTAFPDIEFTPGPPSNFQYDFAKFIVSQNLAFVDWSDFMIDWYEREMVPTFLAPLSMRGKALVRAIHRRETSMMNEGSLSDGGLLHVAQESFVQAVLQSYVRRIPRVAEFQKVVLEGKRDLQK